MDEGKGKRPPRGGRRGAKPQAGRATTPAPAAPTRPRKKPGFAPAGTGVGGLVGRAAERQGFADAEVLLRWSEIVGPALAPLCRPVRMSHGRGQDLTRTLVVAAEGAAALEVEHRGPQIIERVNACFGYRHVTRLRVTQAGARGGSVMGLGASLPGFAEPGAAFEGAAPRTDRTRGEPYAPRPRTAEAAQEAVTITDGIVNDALREALSDLGGYILTEPRRELPDAPLNDAPGSNAAPFHATRRDE
ncbi:MAG: DciA family protein [Pseudomonadota bacterium]